MMINNIQGRNNKVLDVLKEIGNASLRVIAQLASLSKDAVRRAIKSLDRRCVYPESYFWKTKVGQAWLYRLMIAVIFEFGIKKGVGAESISEFLYRINLEKELAISPNTLLILKRKLENLIIKYGQLQEESQAGKLKDIIVACDETFFNELILLVAMDLGSGYLLMEEDAKDRTFETWLEKLKNRLDQMGCHVRHFVSDRAKALIKLALEGLACQAGADLFHAQQELTRWLGNGFRNRLGKIKKEIQNLQAKIQKLGEEDSEQFLTAKEKFLTAKEKQENLEKGKEKYMELLHDISKILHPFTLIGTRRSTQEVVEEIKGKAQALLVLGEEYEIPDNQGRLGKFTRQIDNLASGIDAWWQWMEESIKSFDPILGPGLELYTWVTDYLLPKVYWEQQARRADTIELRDAYRSAAKSALEKLQSHPLTAFLLEAEMCSWAEWMVRQFQRSSSAVEGRNGCLSQNYHNGRGFSGRSLRASTVIHNFDTHQDNDGTTPAERLFGTKFPDLFEWLLQEVGPLPMPRSSRQKKAGNVLTLQSVAA